MIHTGQGDIELTALVHRDLTDAEDFGIRYETPDGDTGILDVAAGAVLHEDGKAIIYQVSNDNWLSEPGRLRLQGFAIFDGATSLGSVVDIKVHQSIQVS